MAQARTDRDDHEWRSFRCPLRVRAARADDPDDGPLRLEGYGLRWDEIITLEFFPGFGIRETFVRGAFRDTIADADHNQGFLVGHEGQPLATSRSGTMVLTEDREGLHVEIEMSRHDPEAVSLHSRVERGLVDGMSVGFTLRGGEYTIDDGDEDEYELHTIERVGRLYEVSATWMPAYGSSELGARQAIQRRHDMLRVRPDRLRAAMTRVLIEDESSRRVTP